jgi:serine/threonine protein kinase
MSSPQSPARGLGGLRGAFTGRSSPAAGRSSSPALSSSPSGQSDDSAGSPDHEDATARHLPARPRPSSAGSERVRRLYIKDFTFEIPLSELKFSRDRQGDKKCIGEGSFAKIFLAHWNGTPCAVKRMTKRQAGITALQRFQAEIALLMTLRHPNITMVFGGCWPAEKADGDENGNANMTANLFSSCIVMEYCELGSLFDVIRTRRGTDTPWMPPNSRFERPSADTADFASSRQNSSSTLRSVAATLERDFGSPQQSKWDWLRQIARGMLYLHSQPNPVMHRDLKCSNVLVGAGFQMKITDFGESRRVQKNAEISDVSHAGTLLFMAPEMVTDENYDVKIDVFSFGVMMVEIFTEGDLLSFYNYAPALAMHKVVGGWRPSLDGIRESQPDLATLIRKSWTQNAVARPGFEEILSFINSLFDEADGEDDYYMDK